MSTVGGSFQENDDHLEEVITVRELRDDDSDDATGGDVPSGKAGPFRVGKWRPYEKDHHDAVTRRVIAFWVLGIVSLLYLAVIGMVCHWINVDELGRIAVVLGPIQALAAAVLGFYFGRQNGS